MKMKPSEFTESRGLMNSEEADRYMEIGQDHFKKGNLEQALKFFNRSYRLEPRDSTEQAIQTCLDKIGAFSGDNNNHARQSASAAKFDAVGDQDIHKIFNKKDFYDILDVAQNAKEDEIKKAYQKIVLKFHPDRNFRPGAYEAFRKITEAFDCLINPEKRREYDGHVNEAPEQRYPYYKRYYSADILPEDIFERFSRNDFLLQDGPKRRAHLAPRDQDRQGSEQKGREQHQGEGNAKKSKLPSFVIPLIIIIVGFLLLDFQSDEPDYSLSKNLRFHIERKTQYLKFPYYVNHKFQQQNSPEVLSIEEDIEKDRTRYWISQCETNRQLRKTLQKNAHYFNNEKRKSLLEKADEISLVECKLANDVQRRYPDFYRSVNFQEIY